mgnify:CR=1 FL=1
MPVATSAFPVRAGLFLDRDDTLIEDARYLGDAIGVRPLPGVRQALRRAGRKYRLFVFSNQSGIGRGYYGWEAAEAVQRRMEALLGLSKRGFDAVCYAPERPDETPVYRKPSPRFILECIQHFALDPAQCWMVGDRLSDLRAGIRAGIRAALVNPTGRALDRELAVYLRRNGIFSYASLLDLIRLLEKG